MVVSSRVILAAWLALFGGCVGSFLNVVIYRLPRGMSLVHPGSRCPHCGHAIRWYHNIPVLGWLMIRGRCHDCDAAISIRYPTIEAVVAAMFLAVAWRGPLATLSASAVDPMAAIAAVELSAWVWYGYHLVWLCGLLVLAVQEIDAAADAEIGVPWRTVGGLVVFGLLVPAGWLGFGVTVVAEGTAQWSGEGRLLAVVGRHLVGLVAAVLLALAVGPATTERAAGDRSRGGFATAGLLLSGAFSGALPACLLGAATAAGHLLATGLTRCLGRWSDPPWTPLLWALALGGVLLWGPAVERPLQSGRWQQVLVALALIVVAGVLSLVRKKIA